MRPVVLVFKEIASNAYATGAVISFEDGYLAGYADALSMKDE